MEMGMHRAANRPSEGFVSACIDSAMALWRAGIGFTRFSMWNQGGEVAIGGDVQGSPKQTPAERPVVKLSVNVTSGYLLTADILLWTDSDFCTFESHDVGAKSVRQEATRWVAQTRRVSKSSRFLSELQAQYSSYKNTLQQLAQKIGDVEQETEEHKYVAVVSLVSPHVTPLPFAKVFNLQTFPDSSPPLFFILKYQLRTLTILLTFALSRLVLDTLGQTPEDRKCFRMINGVLVERTVKDVVPALKTNSEGLRKVLDELLTQYKSKQDEMEKWKVRVYLIILNLYRLHASRM